MQAEAYFTHAVKQLLPLYPEAEAEELMYWVYEDKLLIKKAHLRLFNKEIGLVEEITLNHILERLIAGEPIQYILGYAYFMDLVLSVNKDVLIPRPETEELVIWVSEMANEHKAEALSLLDICTGSGCIALALKKRFSKATISALDVSEVALNTAKKNAKDIGLQIEFIQSSVLDDAGKDLLSKQSANIWVCNPPYITEEEKTEMHENVLAHEPHLALFVSNEDPLLFYRKTIEAFENAATAKALFFEISAYQKPALSALCSNRNLAIEFRKDLQGKDRMLRLVKK